MSESGKLGTGGSDVRAVRLHSMKLRPSKRKLISEYGAVDSGSTALVENIDNSRFESFRPRRPLDFSFNGIPTEDIRPFAEIALSSFNDKNLTQQGSEYELVEVLKCVHHHLPCFYHFNFIARPKNASEAENKPFFAEVNYKRETELGKGNFVCSCCCILGRPGKVTGLRGCRLKCYKHPCLVQHPRDGFTKVFSWSRK